MSFFKDFKDDLSQAVNELMPEESAAPVAEAPQMVDTISEPVAQTSQSDDEELASLLATLDAATAEDVSAVVEADVAAPAPAPAPSIDIPVYTETVAPVVEEKPVVEPIFAEAPVEPEVVKEPVVPIFAEAAPEPEMPKEPVAPIFAPEPEPIQEVKAPVTPVFAPEAEVRPAPINTTMEVHMETGTIPAGMTVVGDITSDGSLEVMGVVKGNITVAGKLNVTGTIEGNSKADEVFADGAKILGEITTVGAVKIAENTVIKGNIAATAAVLAGAVKGDIDVKGPVILDSTAIIMGNIKSKSIQINNGAAIEGLCSQCYADISPVNFFTED